MTCPICRKPVDPDHRPFCSRRCADIDLGRWLTGSYVIPGDEGDAADEQDSPRPSNPEGNDEGQQTGKNGPRH